MFKQQSFLLEALASLETRYLFLPLSSLNGRDTYKSSFGLTSKGLSDCYPSLDST